ncbi:hypothetical protein FRB90_011452, partial [Tulasnella sp. 427]
AEKAYTEARDIFSRIEDQLGLAQCIRSLGDVLQMRNEYTEAEKAYTEARDIFSRIGDQLGLAQCVQGIGDVHRMRDEYTEAEKAYTEARDIFFRIGSELGLAQCVRRLGKLRMPDLVTSGGPAAPHETPKKGTPDLYHEPSATLVTSSSSTTRGETSGSRLSADATLVTSSSGSSAQHNVVQDETDDFSRVGNHMSGASFTEEAKSRLGPIATAEENAT